uniref:Uncharacterized protein n=1 Tax=Arundo donax TaxID=35708 RepID=A0A0A8Z1W9_ARUDO
MTPGLARGAASGVGRSSDSGLGCGDVDGVGLGGGSLLGRVDADGWGSGDANSVGRGCGGRAKGGLYRPPWPASARGGEAQDGHDVHGAAPSAENWQVLTIGIFLWMGLFFG